jgi:uncharacterized protein (TIGR02145 family)
MRATNMVKTMVLIAMLAGITAAQVKYVAVVETEVDAQSGAATKINKAEVRLITTALRNEARNNLSPNKYKIMTTETVLAQSGAVLEECIDENCVITLGSKIGADYIVRGTISKIGAKLTLSIEMYETEDGTLVASTRVSSEKAEGLLEKAVEASAEMYLKFENPHGYMQSSTRPSTKTTPPPQSAVTAQQPIYQTPAPSYQQAHVDGSGMLTDSRDGKKYKTVVIGGKRWMAENLNYQTSNGSWCYNNDNSYCNKYGRLYDWNTAMMVCPAGWHLPSRQEWDNLVVAVGGKNVAGMKLKTKNGWSGNNGSGTDDFGFSAIPSGYRFSDGSFYDAGSYGRWWTTTEYNNDNAYRRGMNYGNDRVGEYYFNKSAGFSVRCVQN